MSTGSFAVNSITLVGNLTSDPVLRSISDNRQVCDLRLAVNDGDSTLFVDVSTFGKAAEACAKFLKKGRQVAVVGRLAFREWDAPDGTHHSKHYVIGQVKFGAGRTTGEDSDPDEEAA